MNRQIVQKTRQFIYLFIISFSFILQPVKRLSSRLVLSLPFSHAQISCCCWFGWQWWCVFLGLVGASFPRHLYISARWWSLFGFYRFPSPPTSHSAAASDWVNKLVHQSLGHIGLANDALLVVLTYGATQLVIVHSRSILPEPPQSCNVSWVFNFKNTWWERNYVKKIYTTVVIYSYI